jgi:recombination protein RecA
MAKNIKYVDYLKELQDGYDQFTSHRDEKLEVIPTGAISLDVSTEVGGIPRGRISMIYGPYSSAKTTLCLNIAKNAVDMGLETLYVDVENSIDGAYINNIVGELPEELFKLYQPDSAEHSLEICELGIRSGAFKLVILDSIGALAPQEELEKDLTDNSMMLIPRLLSKFLRRNTYIIKEKNVAFILVNQVRSNPKSYMGTYEVPGGNALRHFTSLWIALSRGEIIKQGEEKIGIYSTFVIKKNKLGRPFRSFSFPLIFGKGIDRIWNVIEFADMLGVLQKRGSFYSYEGNTLGQGVVKTKAFLEENPKVLDKIVKECYNVTGKMLAEKGEIEYEEEN